MSMKRISKEYAELSQSPPPGYTITLPPSESLHTWHLTLSPPPSTPYHPGRFALILTLPTEYPFKPPTVHFRTRIYHPNVTDDSRGNVCLAILKPDAWKPSTKLLAVLEAVSRLLVEPQPDDPLEDRIAEEFRRDKEAFERNARVGVQRYALGEPEFPPVVADGK